MPSQASDPQAQDASGRALSEGYVLVIPGSRGRTSTVQKGKKTIYTGRAPKALLDLKAAIRYLRHFDSVIPGDAEKIITDGTSAGGAMSSLMGATGNNPAYKPCSRQWAQLTSVMTSLQASAIALSRISTMQTWLMNGCMAIRIVARVSPRVREL